LTIFTYLRHYSIAKHDNPIPAERILLQHYIKEFIYMLTRYLFVTADCYSVLHSVVTYRSWIRKSFQRFARQAQSTSHDGHTGTRIFLSGTSHITWVCVLMDERLSDCGLCSLQSSQWTKNINSICIQYKSRLYEGVWVVRRTTMKRLLDQRSLGYFLK